MSLETWASHDEQWAPAGRHVRRRWWAALTAVSLAGLSACGSSTTPSAKSSTGSAKGSSYTIHAILSITGSASFLGVEQKASLMALQQEVNSTGGIDGHPLNFVISDNQSSASTSVSLASPLVGQVPVLIVGSVTTVDRPVDDLVTSGGPVVYDLSPGDHPARGSFVYSSSDSTTNQTQAFVNFAQTKGWSHIGAITSTDASGQDGWTNIQKAVSASNGAVNITDHETFAPTDVSVTTQLSKIKASNPQALIIWTTGTPLSTVLKGMQQQGMGNLPTMTTNGNESLKEMQSLANDLPAQLYFPSSQYQVGTQNLTGPAKAVVQTFDNAIKTTGQPVPDEGDALAWDPGLILVNAVKKLGVSATASQIHHEISTLTGYVGVNGTYDFTTPSIPDNRGLGIDSVFITQWEKSQTNWVEASGPAGKPTS